MQGDVQERKDLPPDVEMAKQTQNEWLWLQQTLKETDVSPAEKMFLRRLEKSAQAELALRRKVSPQQQPTQSSSRGQQDSSMLTEGQSSTGSNRLTTLTQQFVKQLTDLVSGAKSPPAS